MTTTWTVVAWLAGQVLVVLSSYTTKKTPPAFIVAAEL